MSEEQITNTNVVVESDVSRMRTASEPKAKSNRGRKPKYVDDTARKMAKREQNRTYRERKRNELIALRRLAAEVAKNNNSSDENNSDESPDEKSGNELRESTPSA